MHKFSILFLYVQIEVYVCLFYVLSVLLLHLFPLLYLFVALFSQETARQLRKDAYLLRLEVRLLFKYSYIFLLVLIQFKKGSPAPWASSTSQPAG